MSDKTIVKFKHWDCHAVAGKYENDRIAIRLVNADPDKGPEPIATATINLPDRPLQEDQVIIKNYSENAGIFHSLVAAGYVLPTGITYETGYVHVPVATLTNKFKEEVL